MFLVFDTETTGLPKNYNSPVSDSDNWPRLVQIAWQLHDETGALISSNNFIVRPEGFDIPFNSAKIHGISTEYAKEHGLPLEEVLSLFETVLSKTKIVVGQNIEIYTNADKTPKTSISAQRQISVNIPAYRQAGNFQQND